MAIEMQNHCNGCDLPCINCGRTSVPVAVCDWCGSDEEEFYDIDGEWVCFDCFREDEMNKAKKIPLNSIYKGRLVSCCEWCECEADELFIFDGDDAAICEDCFEEMLRECETISSDTLLERYY